MASRRQSACRTLEWELKELLSRVGRPQIMSNRAPSNRALIIRTPRIRYANCQNTKIQQIILWPALSMPRALRGCSCPQHPGPNLAGEAQGGLEVVGLMPPVAGEDQRLSRLLRRLDCAYKQPVSIIHIYIYVYMYMLACLLFVCRHICIYTAIKNLCRYVYTHIYIYGIGGPQTHTILWYLGPQ